MLKSQKILLIIISPIPKQMLQKLEKVDTINPLSIYKMEFSVMLKNLVKDKFIQS